MPLRVILCWIAVAGFAGQAAAQMQPLRVDPTLLGGSAAPRKETPPAPAPVPSETTPAPQSAPPAKPLTLEAPERIVEPAPAPAAPTPAPAPAPKAAVEPAADVRSVASTLVAPATEREAPKKLAERPVEAVKPAPAKSVSPVHAVAESTRVAGVSSMPALRVDPALLGPMPARREPQPTQVARGAAPSGRAPVELATSASVPPQAAPRTQETESSATEPPQVAERPALPPTYSAYAAAGALPEPRLKATPLLTPVIGDEPRPSFLVADRIHGRNDVEMIAEGDSELRKIGTILTSDKLTYWHLDDEVEALGNVRLQKEQDVFTGPKLRLQVEDNVGFFDKPSYSLRRSQVVKDTRPPDPLETEEPLPLHRIVDSHGEAERLEFKGEGLYKVSKATYSTCAPGRRDWYAEVDELDLDYNREVAEGSHGKVVFMGVPILYSPWLSFSLNNNRKSGFLPPSFGTTNTSGGEASIPWYWNIAPNMDATITPRVMSKRGTQLNVDAGYRSHYYGGSARLEYLPSDRLYGKSRSGYSINHNQIDFGYGFAGAVNLNGVSDDDYYKDLSSPTSPIAHRQLLRQGVLTYGASWWTANLLIQRYQVLQDPSAPAGEPYRRTPQLNIAANRYDMPMGTVFNFSGEYVRFGHPTAVTAQRTTLYPQVSLPLQTSWMRITPKVGIHSTRYRLERQAAGTPETLARQVPIYSIDGSVIFEREVELFGKEAIQTLEPRLFYLYVPARDQSGIPRFDTAVADFNFATAFAENRYGGGDRIADANQITAAVTSRLIDPGSGAEVIRGIIGQRYYFTTQHVTLPGETARTGRTADVLAAVSGLLMPKTYIDTGWQYNPRDRATERFNAAARYQPEIGKVLNAGYRYTRTQLGQVDVSGQWPIWGGWHGVGRYNFSTKDRRLIESVAGLEYDAGCWAVRLVARRIATQTQKATTSIFVQLELNGFSRLGSNPLDVLKRNVPGYGAVNQQLTSDPTPFSYP